MLKITKPKIKRAIKTATKTVGVVAVSAGVGLGTFRSIDRNARKTVFNEIKTENVRTKPKNRLDVQKTLNSKTTEIRFRKANGVKRINVDVAKLNQISKLLPTEVKTNLNNIINNKIQKTNIEIQKNPKLKKKIGTSDYREYLLSLPFEKLEKTFTPQEVRSIKREINKIPIETLNELYKKTSNTYKNSVGYGALVSLLLGAGLFEIAKTKKKNDGNFH